jgi:hypothetical protein
MGNKWEEPRETGCLTITFILGLIVSIIMISSCNKKERIFEDRSFGKHVFDTSESEAQFKDIDYRGVASKDLPKLICAKQFISGPHDSVKGKEVMLFRGYDIQQIWYEFNNKGICDKIIIHNNFKKPFINFENVIHRKVSYNDIKINEYIIE